MTNLFDFIKSAAEYSKETTDIVTLAHGIVNDVNTSQQKCAGLVPSTISKLASLERVNGQPFMPDGFEKQANACLQSHSDTIQLLNNVLNEYGRLKEAYDKQVPSMGRVGNTTKTASSRSNVSGVDGTESKAWQLFTEKMLNL